MRFYVYVIFRPDGSPCYVGKGSGSRWRSRHGRSAPLLDLFSAHGELPIVKVRQRLTEREAFECERTLIGAIGRGSNGPLLNLSPGGEGAARVTEAERRRRTLLTLQCRQRLAQLKHLWIAPAWTDNRGKIGGVSIAASPPWRKKEHKEAMKQRLSDMASARRAA